ncbi:NAC domain-containing protein 83 [Eucalyptus grandis]|uniref:NAC domain-containing protein 83 n=1 Tax=Eucalyptus grandis TaxID=71139 RepID=UPI00192E8E7F|nr:NAC domain-containing protein 83 [Eucalyptus grandis]
MADTLPIGYRFCPSDEQAISYCLAPKVKGEVVFPEFIHEFDVYEKEPWKFFDKNAEESLYVFTKLKMKKSRVERTAGSGYWRGAQSSDVKDCHNNVIGLKKHLNFKVKDGSSSNSQNTEKGSWIMHEYSVPNQEIVMCKIRFKEKKAVENKALQYFSARLSELEKIIGLRILPTSTTKSMHVAKTSTWNHQRECHCFRVLMLSGIYWTA